MESCRTQAVLRVVGLAADNVIRDRHKGDVVGTDITARDGSDYASSNRAGTALNQTRRCHFHPT
ncbi:MAG: hypothetical protein ACQESR_22005 [Planctomycetota bacterium]